MLASTSVLVAASASESASGFFECDGGRKIAGSYVDDDYCDCVDGSDEPHTSACPDVVFACANRPHVPRDIFSSRVDDGVCDCCDGSDERSSDVQCANTCVQLAKESFGGLERGCLRKAERIQEGQDMARRDAEDLEKARQALASSEPEIQRLAAAKAEAEVQEERLKALRAERLERGEVAAAFRLDELDTAMLLQALVRLGLAQGVEGVDRLHEVLGEHEDLSDTMDDVDSADMIEVAMEARDAKAEAAAAAASSSPNPDAELSDDGVSGSGSCAAHEACGFERAMLELLPLADAPKPALRQVLDAFADETRQTPDLAQISRELLGGVGIVLDDAAVAAALELIAPFQYLPADEARAALQKAVDAVSDAAATVKRLAPIEVMAEAFGERSAWRPLLGRCFEFRSGAAQSSDEPSFEYSVCPFDRISQDGETSLGNFSGWQPLVQGEADELQRSSGRPEPPVGRMGFDGGSQCDEQPRRATLLFVCGEEDAVVEMKEPSTCVYEGWFATPSACSGLVLRERYEELLAMSGEAGSGMEIRPEVRELFDMA